LNGFKKRQRQKLKVFGIMLKIVDSKIKAERGAGIDSNE